VPGLFARAMQGAGWVWRSDVTWVKPSALPESVSGTRWERCRVKVRAQAEPDGAGQYAAGSGQRTARPQSGGMGNVPEAYQTEWADCPGCPKCAPHGGLVLRRGNGRPTKATEAILLFAKQPGYYFDQEAVREALAPFTTQYLTNGWGANDGGKFPDEGRDGDRLRGTLRAERTNPSGRNLRDWWVLSPEPLSDAHYAAFPTSLPERCIKAGTSEWGCCPQCGAAWARVISSRFVKLANRNPTRKALREDAQMADVNSAEAMGYNDTTTLGWRPTCPCSEQPPVPARVLDPFGGSGSTGLAANRLGRDGTLIELNPAYADLAKKRLWREPLSLFAHERPAEALT
jgi:hypothetical protein